MTRKPKPTAAERWRGLETTQRKFVASVIQHARRPGGLSYYDEPLQFALSVLREAARAPGKRTKGRGKR